MPCYFPVQIKNPKKDSFERGIRNITVPCGKCVGCSLEYSRQWAVRLMHEKQMHENSCFPTLTYSDINLPWGVERPTLNPRDLQLFIKRLRKKYGQGIRFFASGEYGERTYRPHYHAIIFGIDFEDKKIHSTKNGSTTYTSNILDNLWGLGNCIIGDVTFESCAYVSRYIIGKRENKDTNQSNNIQPEFVRMSRRPGIGKPWLNKYFNDVFPQDIVYIRGGLKCQPPKYYLSQLELQNPEQYLEIKSKREKNSYKRDKDNSPQKLKVREIIKNAQIKTLTRSL